MGVAAEKYAFSEEGICVTLFPLKIHFTKKRVLRKALNRDPFDWEWHRPAVVLLDIQIRFPYIQPNERPVRIMNTTWRERSLI